MARAITVHPEIILLDEPFSHINNFKKQSLRKKFLRSLRAKNIAWVIATDDHEDVLPCADNMLVLENQRILIEVSLKGLYNSPKHLLVTSFFRDYSLINNTIYCAHLIFVVEKSNLAVVAKHTFYIESFF